MNAPVSEELVPEGCYTGVLNRQNLKNNSSRDQLVLATLWHRGRDNCLCCKAVGAVDAHLVHKFPPDVAVLSFGQVAEARRLKLVLDVMRQTNRVGVSRSQASTNVKGRKGYLL